MDQPVEMLTIDDHRVFAESLAAALGRFDDIGPVHVASTAEDAVAAVRTHRPDIVVADYRLRDIAGAELIELMLEASGGDCRILVLTVLSDRQTIAEAKAAGAAGLLTKGASLEEVHDAIVTIARGGTLFAEDAPSHESIVPLTARETEVLEMIAGGLTSNEIAERLVVSPNTVRNHAQQVLTKLGVSSRMQAVAEARRIGYLPIEPA